MSFSTPRLFVIAAVAALFASPQASAQVCATNSGMYFDRWPDIQTVTCGSRSSSLFEVSFSGRPYVLQTNGCGMFYYDVSGTGVPSGAATNPFGNSSVYAHNEFRTRHLAVLDDFPYGMQSHSSEGWAIFRIGLSGSTITGFNLVERFVFSTSVNDSNWPIGAKLFRAGNRVYVVGRYLDKETSTLAIHDFGTGQSAPPMTFMSSLPEASASPGMYDVIEGSNGPILYVYNADGARLYNVSNPAAPVYLGLRNSEGLILRGTIGTLYPRGTAVVDLGSSKRLYTYAQTGYFYIFNVTDPTNPQQLQKVAVGGGGAARARLGAEGSQLALMTARTNGQPKIRYI